MPLGRAGRREGVLIFLALFFSDHNKPNFFWLSHRPPINVNRSFPTRCPPDGRGRPGPIRAKVAALERAATQEREALERGAQLKQKAHQLAHLESSNHWCRAVPSVVVFFGKGGSEGEAGVGRENRGWLPPLVTSM